LVCIQADGSYQYSDDASESEYDVYEWMRHERRRHADLGTSVCSRDDDDDDVSQTSPVTWPLSDVDRSTFYDNDDEVDASSSSANSEESRSLQSQPQINEVTVVYVKYPDECCPKCCTASCQFWEAFDRTRVGRAWFTWRNVNFKIVEHKYFETFIIVMILISSLALVSRFLDITFINPAFFHRMKGKGKGM